MSELDPGLQGYHTYAAVDTYCIAWYTFEQMNWQGWTRVDNTAQVGLFFHVDDFAGLGGGIKGHLIPLDGTKSMWCGARPNASDPYLCSWRNAPGYGNNWNQMLATGPITVVGAITWSFRAWYDSEPNYDYTRIEYDAGNNNWAAVAEYHGYGDSVASYFIPIQTTRTKLRFHFTSDGACSDQDGLWNSDGAFIVDDIRVQDQAGFNGYQDFETAAVGANNAGIWTAGTEVPFGKYSSLKNNLQDKDPCGDNFATQVVFFVGSPYPSSNYPGLYDTPFCMGAGGISAPCQNEMIVSPVIDMTKYSLNCNNVQNGTIPPADLTLLGGVYLEFTVYRDLPLPNLVFYQWHVRSIVGGCPGLWLDDGYLYYGPEQAYIVSNIDVSSKIAGNAPVQIALGVVDMCDVWYLLNGNCALHTPSPWIDNVRLYRYKTAGPQWSWRDIDLFQDNFPKEEAPPLRNVRADAANDINPKDNPVIRPGDSIVVDCSSLLGGGIAMDDGKPAVYLHVMAEWVGHPPAPLGEYIHGPQLQGTYGLWLQTMGAWDKFRCAPDTKAGSSAPHRDEILCDFARTQSGVVADKYMVDINDSLFVPGYIIEYYFTAIDNAGVETALPPWARTRGPYFEFTCLPTGNSDVLFVDDATGRGSWNGSVEDYWNPVFKAVLPASNQPDRYDVLGPTSMLSNGPGSRANAALMRSQYNMVIWDSGDLESGTISDGTVNSDKSNDCQLLIDWMSQADHPVGLWVCGENVAYDLTVNDQLSTPALTLMSTWCGGTLVNTSYFQVTGGLRGGGVITPKVTGIAGSIFYEGGVPDTWYVSGGCPIINKFDCLDRTANGVYAAMYPPFHDTNYYAAIQTEQQNSLNQPVRTMWFGFSYMYVRDDAMGAPEDRFEIAQDVFSWMQNTTKIDFTGTGTTPAVNKLAQNFPNPFNPATMINYSVKEKGVVTLKVYDVAGQLVRTLENGVKDAGSYTATWNGKNDRGASVASGIYFYKMETKGFNETKKMVMLR